MRNLKLPLFVALAVFTLALGASCTNDTAETEELYIQSPDGNENPNDKDGSN